LSELHPIDAADAASSDQSNERRCDFCISNLAVAM
jgi:hypothetical protein